MIDLHCHILPGLDDGASSLSVSLDMARSAAAEGVSVIACTPHILPGLYANSGPQIRRAVEHLQCSLDDNEIPVRLVPGADVHMVPDLLAQLRSGHALSLADSRYVLVEPPHQAVPPRVEDFFFQLVVAGYVPILTHPERLAWIGAQYALVQRLLGAGVWMQITAGSLAGSFGRTARYWAERMLEEGAVHIIATDAHDISRRPPNLGLARDLAAKRVGVGEAENLVITRPAGVLANENPSNLPLPVPCDRFLEVMNVECSHSAKGRGPVRRGPLARVRSLSDRVRRALGRRDGKWADHARPDGERRVGHPA